MLGLNLGVYIAFFLLVGCAVVAMAGRPEVGIYAIVASLPQQSGRYKLHQFPAGNHLIEILLVATMIGLLVSRRPIWPHVRFRGWIIGFAIVTYVSMIIGTLLTAAPFPLPVIDQRFTMWYMLMEGPLIFLLAYSAIDDKRKMSILLAAMLFSYIVVNRSFYRSMSGRDLSHFSSALRDAGSLVNAGPNGLAAFQAQGVVLLVAMFGGLRSWWVKVMAAAAMVMGAFGLAFSFSRGAYLGFMAGVAYLGFTRMRWILPFLLMFAIGYKVLLPDAVVERFDTVVSDDAETGERFDHSTQGRFTMWELALKTTMKDPILGVGYFTFRFFVEEGSLKDTHNLYIRFLVETGLIGLSFVVVLFFRSFLEGHRLSKMTDDPLIRTIGTGFAAYMTCVIVVNLFGDRWTYLEISGFTWAMLAMVLRGHLMLQEPQGADMVLTPAVAAGPPLVGLAPPPQVPDPGGKTRRYPKLLGR